MTLGRRKLTEAFNALPPRDLKPGELLATSAGYRSGIFRLHTGWACQFCDLSDCGCAIIDVYVPGDVIGLDMLLQTRRPERIFTLTSVTVEMIPAQHVLIDLIADRSLALYIFWVLNHHQRRVARRLAANTRFEAQARLAQMLLDFYIRLHRRRLVTGSTYSLPLTQAQMGDYVGLTTVHINRVLRSLRDQRVVNLEKNCVTIIDLERLKKLAREDEVTNSALTSANALRDAGKASSRGRGDGDLDSRLAHEATRDLVQSRIATV
jgi:CRP-like cAMP-binding protein